MHLLYNGSLNSVSSQLGSSCQGHRYGTEKSGSTARPSRPSRTKSHLPGNSPPASQAGRRVGPALHPSASLVKSFPGLAVGTAGEHREIIKNRGKSRALSTSSFRMLRWALLTHPIPLAIGYLCSGGYFLLPNRE